MVLSSTLSSLLGFDLLPERKYVDRAVLPSRRRAKNSLLLTAKLSLSSPWIRPLCISPVHALLVVEHDYKEALHALVIELLEELVSASKRLAIQRTLLLHNAIECEPDVRSARCRQSEAVLVDGNTAISGIWQVTLHNADWLSVALLLVEVLRSVLSGALSEATIWDGRLACARKGRLCRTPQKQGSEGGHGLRLRRI